MKNLNYKFIKFHFICFICFATYFSQAHPHGYPYPGHPPINACSSACQTFSGFVCPLINYAPQSFSSCLTSGFFYLCLNSHPFNPSPVCLLKGNPCVCATPHINYFYGTSYYVYENGFTF